jgi:hypothetical protein
MFQEKVDQNLQLFYSSLYPHPPRDTRKMKVRSNDISKMMNDWKLFVLYFTSNNKSWKPLMNNCQITLKSVTLQKLARGQSPLKQSNYTAEYHWHSHSMTIWSSVTSLMRDIARQDRQDSSPYSTTRKAIYCNKKKRQYSWKRTNILE